MFGILNIKKGKNYREKIQNLLTKKLIIIFMIFENKLIQNNLEEISKLKFKDDNLDKFRDFLFNKIFY